MSIVDGYLNRTFGNFKITSLVGRGQDADLFQCLDLSTDLPYLLRINLSDQAIQRGWPVLPPHNYKAEFKNIEAARKSASIIYRELNNKQGTVELPLRRGHPSKIDDSQLPPPIYGIWKERYLVPVSSIIRVKLAWDVDKVLQKQIYANVTSYFMLWEDIISLLVGEGFIALKSRADIAKWDERWGRLLGGQALITSVKQFTKGYNTEKENQDLVKLISADGGYLPLEENLLFRICALIERRFMTVDEAYATLKCRHFRVNISKLEIQQMLDLFTILTGQKYSPPEQSIKLITFVLSLLEHQPFGAEKDLIEFEYRQSLPEVNNYSLFLQEDGRARLGVITLIPN